MTSPRDRWWRIENADEVASPALLLYPDRAEENIRRMVAMAGDASRLTPHVKTHKLAPFIEMHLAHGVQRFKCATIAEAEMVAAAGASDLLLAYQPVGPAIHRVIALARQFPGTRVSVIADDARIIDAIDQAAQDAGIRVPVLIDLDVGMHRTGVAPGPEARALYHRLANRRGVEPGGLHAYDGHLRDADPTTRIQHSDAAFKAVEDLRRELLAEGLPVPRVIAGGSPTFPAHARRPDVELSPGTTVLWDAGYLTQLPDLDFLPSAVLLTRVVSKPGGGRVCVDLGHKAVASEGPHPRVQFLDPVLDDARFVGHSEEHLVFETSRAFGLAVGDVCYGLPWHVCPTVALHSEALVVEDGRVVDRWAIRARARRLTV
jgi:D-serine deaminase-like pyridoxal phosphate-dependent protein